MGFFSNLRARKMNEKIRLLIHSGSNDVVLRDVRYEAALKFAFEAGTGHSPGPDGLGDGVHFTLNVDGADYYVYIAKHIDGSTYLGIDDVEEQRRLFRERLAGQAF